MTRYAIVRNATDRSQAEAYLPGNYTVIGELAEFDTQFSAVAPDGVAVTGQRLVFVIAGQDNAGWTMDGYVIPRYASGLIWAEEITADHEAVKAVTT